MQFFGVRMARGVEPGPVLKPWNDQSMSPWRAGITPLEYICQERESGRQAPGRQIGFQMSAMTRRQLVKYAGMGVRGGLPSE